LKILIVRLRLIGDVIFTTPFVRALRHRYPDAHLAYLVERSAAVVVEHNPHLSEIITVDHSRGWQRLRDDLTIAAALRRRQFDAAIDLHGGPRSAWFTWTSGASVRVGYDVPGRSWMYTRVVTRPKAFRPRHAVENQWDLLSAFDPALTRPVGRTDDPVEMTVDPALAERAGDRLAARGVHGNDRLTIMHVSAGNPFRRWPESSFADAAAAIASLAPDCWVLVTAGPSDREAAARVVGAARARAGAAAARILDDEGLSLAQLRAVLEHGSLFIGGDSGPMHVASTSTIPIIGLYGPTLPVRSSPWRSPSIAGISIEAGPLPCRPCDQRVCVPGDFRCLTAITPGQVIEAARQVLVAGRPGESGARR